MSKIRGFTLIELMIVVAIIGILASIAIPAMQDYMGRSQLMDGVRGTAGLRTSVAEYYALNGTMPSSGDMSGADALLEGKYFTAGAVSVAGGIISVSFSSGVLNGQTLQLEPTPNALANQVAEWTCAGVDARYMPASCQP